MRTYFIIKIITFNGALFSESFVHLSNENKSYGLSVFACKHTINRKPNLRIIQ